MTFPPDLFSCLTQWKICWRCQLRVAAYDTDIQVYKTFEKTIEKSLGLTQNSGGICPLCLGILQETDTLIQISNDSELKGVDSRINSVIDAVKTADYHITGLHFQLNLPVCFMIREHSLWLALKKKYPDWANDTNKNNIKCIKSVWKWLIKDLIYPKLKVPYVPGPLKVDDISTVTVEIEFKYDRSDTECNVLATSDPKNFDRRRRGVDRYNWSMFNRVVVEKSLNSLSEERFCKDFSVPPSVEPQCTPATIKSINLKRHCCLYVGGRYLKLSRRLPQTPWILDGSRRMESSVEELITAPIATVFQPKKMTFTSAGREDVDVRMLNKGRPFIVEIEDSKYLYPNDSGDSKKSLRSLENQINEDAKGLIHVDQLQIVSKECAAIVKLGEEEKPKRYSALVWTETPWSQDDLQRLNKLERIDIAQWTPIRVLHRRTLLERDRAIYELKARPIKSSSDEQDVKTENGVMCVPVPGVDEDSSLISRYSPEQLFVLELRCQAGTYVKEFVHGDLGRTQPNLSSFIFKQCDILALDVVEVELNWPPPS